MNGVLIKCMVHDEKYTNMINITEQQRYGSRLVTLMSERSHIFEGGPDRIEEVLNRVMMTEGAG